MSDTVGQGGACILNEVISPVQLLSQDCENNSQELKDIHVYRKTLGE